MISLLLIGTGVVVVVMLLLWLLSLRQDNFSYVDIGWSANFVVLALVYGLLGDGDPIRRWLIGGMFALWGARLAWHLAARIVGQPEEGRYVQLRADWGAGGHLNWKFLVFFQFQALLNVMLSLPLLLAAVNPQPRLSPWEFAGVVLWCIGLVGESMADRQLKQFKRSSAGHGQVCKVGLWGWSRHPNYFFEWVIWLGYALFALGSPYGWICLALPLLMLHFLLNVTGVKATEEQALRSKGDAYREYQRTVSVFIPLPPRST